MLAAGAAQTAYRLVTDPTEASPLVAKSTWDSVRMKSNHSRQIPYAGPLPKTEERIFGDGNAAAVLGLNVQLGRGNGSLKS